MSLARLYNALIEAGASPRSATDAMEAVEISRDEPWKRNIEKRLARLELMNATNTALVLAILIRTFF